MLHTHPLNRSRLLAFDGYYKGNKYERDQRLEVWKGSAVNVTIHRRKVAWDVTPTDPFLPARTYGVLVNGQRRTTVKRPICPLK